MVFRSRHPLSPSAVATAAATVLLTSTIAVGQDVDLIVTSVDTSSMATDFQTLAVSGTVGANLENSGPGDIVVDFHVTFFEDANNNRLYDPGTDLLLGTDVVTGGLGPGAMSSASTTVDAALAFAGNIIYAFVDSDEVVAESDEFNNVWNSGTDCLVVPTPGQFDAVLEWNWDGTPGSPLPNHIQVMMTPVVANLTDDNADGQINDDDTPDVVFSAFAGSSWTQDGVIVALSGNDGSEIFTTPFTTDLDVEPVGQLAIGDIDGDGLPEIIANEDITDTALNQGTEGRLIVFEHDGTFKFKSSVIERLQWGGAALADLNLDGTPEIIVGRQVLDNSGVLLATGSGGQGKNTVGPLSTVADLDGDERPEIVAGSTAYSVDTDGANAITGLTPFWQAATGDGFSAVADFDGDDLPEVVLVSAGSVSLLDGLTGTVIGGPTALPSGAGGAPTIEDFDNDGQAEIGVAGGGFYVVFDTDGTILWSQPIQDLSSGRTGSSSFDFDGDGAADVVYSDEQFLRVFSGVDGTVLLELPNTSGTALENPVVADVDRDGNAEIIVAGNNYATSAPVSNTGIRVWGSVSDAWVNTRRIWNQHTYHITNVNDDGSIPTDEEANWPLFNNFRAQKARTSDEIFAAPDLTASFLRYSTSPITSVTARIGNGGAVIAGPGIPVSFYDGDPLGGGTLLGTVSTSVGLAPGEYEDVSLALPSAFVVSTDIHVVVDDLGSGIPFSTQNECNEANNPQFFTVGPCAFVSDLVLNHQTVGTTETFQACNTITAGPTFEISASGNVTLRSGAKVILDDGVSVLAGATLVVEIDPSLTSP